jgi:hypothetical protein
VAEALKGGIGGVREVGRVRARVQLDAARDLVLVAKDLQLRDVDEALKAEQ